MPPRPAPWRLCLVAVYGGLDEFGVRWACRVHAGQVHPDDRRAVGVLGDAFRVAHADMRPAGPFDPLQQSLLEQKRTAALVFSSVGVGSSLPGFLPCVALP